MLTLRSATLSVLLGLLLAFGFSFGATRALADGPANAAVSVMPAYQGAPFVSQYCVNGSVPGPYGCHSTAASSTYYNYPQSYYNAAYNYCYAYYPTCQYYHSYYNYDFMYPQVYAVDCADPYYGTVWVGYSTASYVCY
jgi:hypothetical protein